MVKTVTKANSVSKGEDIVLYYEGQKVGHGVERSVGN
jgi:hypothetical protein